MKDPQRLRNQHIMTVHQHLIGRIALGIRSVFVGHSLRTLRIRCMDDGHALLFVTMDASYTLNIPWSFVLFVGSSLTKTDFGRECVRICTLPNFEKKISTLSIRNLYSLLCDSGFKYICLHRGIVGFMFLSFITPMDIFVGSFCSPISCH
ncbi:MAG: hypothetical protein ABW185_26250, partial [Sedimenticola sp.]